MSELAEAIWALLRRRLSLADPRITYAELAAELRETSEDFEFLYHRSRELYAALGEIGRACQRLRLPPLPALVVRADTRRPGDAYYGGRRMQGLSRDERVALWQQDLEAVKQANYPSRPRTR
jgi:hypothetical protein